MAKANIVISIFIACLKASSIDIYCFFLFECLASSRDIFCFFLFECLASSRDIFCFFLFECLASSRDIFCFFLFECLQAQEILNRIFLILFYNLKLLIEFNLAKAKSAISFLIACLKASSRDINFFSLLLLV